PAPPLPTPVVNGTKADSSDSALAIGEPADLMSCESVQLFLDRAQAVRADFQLTPRNAPTVAALCHLLEGIPLAIELAAARAQALTPKHMLDRLSQRFELLADRRAEKQSHHRSLW